MARTKVQSELIATNAISGTIIADGAITSTHLAANCVDSSELITGSIDTIHIAANQVTATKIVTNGVLTRHISDDQVTAAKLAHSINTDIATGVTANTTANAALPKAGGTMTGALTVSATTATINITGGSSGASLINFGDSDDGNVGRIYYDHTDNFMQFKTNDSEKMRIDSSGNVLINSGVYLSWGTNGASSIELVYTLTGLIDQSFVPPIYVGQAGAGLGFNLENIQIPKTSWIYANRKIESGIVLSLKLNIPVGSTIDIQDPLNARVNCNKVQVCIIDML